jgi:hypothetical protein
VLFSILVPIWKYSSQQVDLNKTSLIL